MMDLTDCLGAIRRFKNISHKAVAEKTGKTTADRVESRTIGCDLELAQAIADAIGAKVTVKVEFEGFSQEVPLFVNPKSE